MRAERQRATAGTMALNEALVRKSYQQRSQKSSTINLFLAGLVFTLQVQQLTLPEQASVLGLVDGLIRLKIDLGLLKEPGHVC